MNMEFRTPVHIPASDFQINYSTRMMLFGSCFSENIGNLLLEDKFIADVNPFGILYNPLSIIAAMKRLLDDKSFTQEELVTRNDLFHSFMHHGSFSAVSADLCLQNITKRFIPSACSIKKTDLFLITFGTAYVYQLKDNKEVVGNCHKFPSDLFLRTRLSVLDIVDEWVSFISMIQKINSETKFVFTVSPIRHWKDGAHENQISKSILLLAIDQLCHIFPKSVYYFPAYEIMMDELRDYRFYAEDMLHPSNIASQYIWKCFGETFFSNETFKIIGEWRSFKHAIRHRPLNPNTRECTSFFEETLKKLHVFAKKYPYINCVEEVEAIKKKLMNGA